MTLFGRKTRIALVSWETKSFYCSQKMSNKNWNFRAELQPFLRDEGKTSPSPFRQTWWTPTQLKARITKNEKKNELKVGIVMRKKLFFERHPNKKRWIGCRIETAWDSNVKPSTKLLEKGSTSSILSNSGRSIFGQKLYFLISWNFRATLV